MAEWAYGKGTSEPRTFVVNTEAGDLLFVAGGTVGHGSSARKIELIGGNLVIPAKKVGDVELAEITLTDGLEGYWEVGEARSVIFSATLPQGSRVAGASEKAADLAAMLLEGFEVVRGPRRSVVFTREEGGVPVGYVPDAQAPHDSMAAWLDQQLSVPYRSATISALRRRGIADAIDCQLHDPAFVTGTFALRGTPPMYFWTPAGGEEKFVDHHCRGDELVELGDLVANGKAVRLGLNKVDGKMVEVVGLTAFSDTGYTGLGGNPFAFLVPVKPGEQRTLHVVVRYELGTTVLGFTVSRRKDVNAEAEARRLRQSMTAAIVRRPIAFDENSRRQYIVLPSGELLVVV